MGSRYRLSGSRCSPFFIVVVFLQLRCPDLLRVRCMDCGCFDTLPSAAPLLLHNTSPKQHPSTRTARSQWHLMEVAPACNGREEVGWAQQNVFNASRYMLFNSQITPRVKLSWCLMAECLARSHRFSVSPSTLHIPM